MIRIRAAILRSTSPTVHKLVTGLLSAWFLTLSLPLPGLAAPREGGSLDKTFGTAGQVTTDFGGVDEAFALAIQGNGKIVVAGATCNSTFTECNFALARYHNGNLDKTLGTGGKVTTNFGGVDQAFAVAIQGDGKIVVAGATCNSNSTDCNFALARYNADDSLDTTFGTGGQVTTDFGGRDDAIALAIDGDSKMVVAGRTRNSTDCNFALARYNTDGSLDTFFGTAGQVTTDFGGSDSAFALAIQSDGQIVVAGDTCNSTFTDCNF